MAGNQGLFQAFQMLQQGVGSLSQGMQQYAIGNAVNEANEQVRQLRSAQIEETERLAGIRQVAENLTMRMAGMGAPAAQIEQVGNMLAPKPRTVQTFEQGAAEALASGDTAGYEKFQQGIQQKQEHDLAKIREAGTLRIQGAAATQDAKMPKEQIKALNDFGKVAKAEIDGLKALEAAPGELAKGNLGYVLNLKSLLKGTDPRISDKDYETAAPNIGMLERTNRVYDALVNNQPLPEDEAAVKELLRGLTGRFKKQLKKQAVGFAKSRGKLVKMSPEDLANRILTERMPDEVSDSPAPASDGSMAPAPAPGAPSGGGIRGVKIYNPKKGG